MGSTVIGKKSNLMNAHLFTLISALAFKSVWQLSRMRYLIFLIGYNDKILEPILTVSSEMLIRIDALMLISKAHNTLMSSMTYRLDISRQLNGNYVCVHHCLLCLLFADHA